MFGSYISLGWIDFSSCLSWHTGNISYLWRKMIFIGHILGQLLIIDLLCCWCYFFGSDLASVLYIWSLFRIVSEQAVSPAWIVSLEGRDHTIMLCAEQGTRESCPDNKGWRWAQLADLDSQSGHFRLESMSCLSHSFFPWQFLWCYSSLWYKVLFYFT